VSAAASAPRADRFAGVLREVGPLRSALTVGLLVATVVLLAHDRAVRHAEACASAFLVRSTWGPDARCVDDNALYRIDGVLVGHTVTIGCSAVVLLVPFVVVAALLLPVRRMPAVVTLSALGFAALVVASVNQLRLLTIATGMHLWGLEHGYGVTHVLAGSIVSTVGVVSGGLTFLVLLTRGARVVRRG
jgi:exosortase/archaeosortase family protein